MVNSQFSSAHRLLLFTVIAAIAFVATFLFYSADIIVKACAILFGLAVVYLTVHVVLPPEERAQRTVRFATWAFLLVATGSQTVPVWVPFLVEYLPLSEKSSNLLTQGAGGGYAVTLTALAAYVCLLVFGVDRSALGKVPIDIKKDFPDLNFAQRLDIFCEELLSELNVVERDLRWNVSHFVSIDAEVEIVSDTGRTRTVMDLFSALKRVRSSGLVLVLGVPGSGKSVALRKLCRELMADVGKSGRIPVYVNLKEWADTEPWTLDRKPTERDLKEFVYRNVRDRLSDQTKPFFDTYFDRLVAAGRIFFALDSFDEIPGLLDVSEASIILRDISDVIVKFLRGAPVARGIIASRYYRRPFIYMADRTTIEIRPLTERQVAAAISNVAVDVAGIQQKIFNRYAEIGAAARNPFSLGLLLQYYSRKADLPSRISDLFKDYLDESLLSADEFIIEAGLTRSVVWQAMGDISWTMFSTEGYGLDMPFKVLQEKNPLLPLDAILDVLQRSRLVRIGSPRRTVSFVHRRFNEYFLVQRFVVDPKLAPLDAIPTDSRWRDAMVLFSEVADDATAEGIADYCWRQVDRFKEVDLQFDHDTYLRRLHSIRFLVEAFRGRLSSLGSFQDALGNYLLTVAKNDTDLLSTKHAVEAAGLVKAATAHQVLLAALSRGNEWIGATALKSARYLPSLPPTVQNALTMYLHQMPTLTLILRFSELRFSLSTSDVYRKIRVTLTYLFISRIVYFASVCLLSIYSGQFRVILAMGLAVVAANMYISRRWRSDFITPPMMATTIRRAKDAARVDLLSATFDFILAGSRVGIAVMWFAPAILIPVSVIFAAIGETQNLVLRLTVGSTSEAGGSIAAYVGAAHWYWSLLWNYWTPALLLLTPWGEVLGWIKRLHFRDVGRFGWDFVARNTVPMAKNVVTYSLAGTVFVVILRFTPAWLSAALGVALLVLGSVASLYATHRFLVHTFVDGYQDRKKLKAAMLNFSPSRKAIAVYFGSLKTALARKRYAMFVDGRVSDNINEFSDLSNQWPDNIRPNVDADEGSTILARVDARSFRLDY